MGTGDLYSPELPDHIINRVQSLLPRNKAAQTTLLSKTWRAAWSTRPTIDLDESQIPYDPSSSYIKIDTLVSYAKKTFRRYEESDLRIKAFTLCLGSEWYNQSGLTTKWTLKALKLGATDITFRSLNNENRAIAIPHRELFLSESLVRLCLEHTIIRRPKVINCRGLRSLILIHVYISSDSLFDIFSCCPLIEHLSLSDIHSNRLCNFEDADKDEADHQYEKHGLEKLTSLVMCQVEYHIQQLLLDALSSSKFPNLKECTLKLTSDDRSYLGHRAAREKQIISSRSLEILSFGLDKERYYDSKDIPRFEFDVPSIRKFTFEGSYMLNLYFRPTMGQWEESLVSLHMKRNDGLSKEWFLELSKFLAKLRLSKIHLCLHLNEREMPDLENYDCQEDDIEGLYAHQVEDLTIDKEDLPTLRFNDLLDGLFRICRPKMITQYVSPPVDNDDEMSDNYGNRWRHRNDNENARNNDVLLCKAIEQVVKVKNTLMSTDFMHGLTDLDEVIAQKLVDDVWEPLPMDSILDDSESEQRRFRFQLQWKPSLNQYMSPSDDDDDDDNDDDDEDDDYDDDDEDEEW